MIDCTKKRQVTHAVDAAAIGSSANHQTAEQTHGGLLQKETHTCFANSWWGEVACVPEEGRDIVRSAPRSSAQRVHCIRRAAQSVPVSSAQTQAQAPGWHVGHERGVAGRRTAVHSAAADCRDRLSAAARTTTPPACRTRARAARRSSGGGKMNANDRRNFKPSEEMPKLKPNECHRKVTRI